MTGLVLALLASHSLAVPKPEGFQGRWRAERMIGADRGGVTASFRDMLGKEVVWSTDGVTTPTGRCTTSGGKVVEVPNTQLENDWGGQAISDLSISPILRKEAFGGKITPVFRESDSLCVQDAVLVGRNRLILMLDNGYIYLFRRTPVGRAAGF